MMSNRHAMPARSANAPAGSTGIEILVLLGMRQLAVFAIALEGAGVLVKPVKDNRPGLAPPYALTQCATPVVPDAADDIAYGVFMTEVELRYDPLTGQRFALEPDFLLGPGRSKVHTTLLQLLMRYSLADYLFYNKDTPLYY